MMLAAKIERLIAKYLFLVLGLFSAYVCFDLGSRSEDSSVGILASRETPAYPAIDAGFNGGALGFGLISSTCFACFVVISTKKVDNLEK